MWNDKPYWNLLCRSTKTPKTKICDYSENVQPSYEGTLFFLGGGGVYYYYYFVAVYGLIEYTLLLKCWCDLKFNKTNVFHLSFFGRKKELKVVSVFLFLWRTLWLSVFIILWHFITYTLLVRHKTGLFVIKNRFRKPCHGSIVIFYGNCCFFHFSKDKRTAVE